MEAKPPDSVIAQLPKADVPHEMHGFVSPTHGPILVLIMQNVRPDVGVYDASDGRSLGWFIAQSGRSDKGTVTSHVYQSSDGPVLALATDDGGVRQWELPSGREARTSFEPGGRSRAMSSYRAGDRTNLVIADAEGHLRRFDAATGAPVGPAVRFGPEEPPPPGRLARLTRRPAPPDPVLISSRALTVGVSAGEPTVLVVDGDDRLWRVLPDAETTEQVPLDPKLGVRQVMPDPLARSGIFLIDGPGFVGLCDVGRGELVGPMMPVDDVPDGVGAAVVGDELRVFAAVDGRILRFEAGAETAPGQIFGPPPGADHEDFLEDLCVLPVGERTAVLATDGGCIRRFDAATGEPWPAS